MNTLKITNLTKTYPNGVKALDKVSLTITNGMFGLLGPNGAGKSSLIRTLSLLQEPSSGSVTFNAKSMFAHAQRIRSQLGYLPQEFGVYPRMSALELLNHIAVLKGIKGRRERKDQILSLLQLTNLYKNRNNYVSNYSGGMQQRFGIAQALLGSPKLIIVDEPTAGLDPEERSRFNNLLSEIGEEIIVILSTHIVEDVRELCTNMAIMNGGQIVAQGAPNELIKSIEGKVWQLTIDKSDLEKYRASYTVLSSHLYGGRLRIRVLCNHQPSQGFKSVNADLEDVYFSVLIANI